MELKEKSQTKKPIISANAVSSIRIVATVFLLFLKPLSVLFFAVLTFAGLTDVLDGFIARKTNTQSDLGAKLDSIADLMFYCVMVIKILPALIEKLPKSIWFAVAAVLFIRLLSYLVAAVKFKRFSSMHTYLNKVTGFAVFTVPYFLPSVVAVYYCFFVCFIGGVSSTEELLIHIFSKEYNENKKSIFLKLKSEDMP